MQKNSLTSRERCDITGRQGGGNETHSHLARAGSSSRKPQGLTETQLRRKN